MPMRDATDIHVDEVILHILPRDKPNPQLSQLPIPPDSDERIFNYFKAHIENSLRDPQARTARFTDFQNPRAVVCRGLQDGSIELVEGSQRLAKDLHAILRRDERLATGDLALCRFRGKEGDEEKRYLALMKLDPATAFRQKRRRGPQGEPYITFEIEKEIMPTERERLQKCAFVRNLDPRPEDYDMLLLDLQIRTPDGPVVAKFFKKNFLQAELALNDEEATKLIYRKLGVARKVLKPRLDADRYEHLERTFNGALAASTVDIADLVESLDLEENEKKVVSRSLSEIPQNVVPIVQGVVEKERVKETETYLGDDGLKVVKPLIYPEEYFIVEPPTEDLPRYRITIESEIWEPQTKTRTKEQAVDTERQVA